MIHKVAAPLLLLAVATVLIQRATFNARTMDYRNSNFVFFWLAARMVVAHENPYDTTQWLSQHDANEITWRPNRIFPYPLPLAFLLAPLGMLPLQSAYLTWQIASGLALAVSVWLLLGRGPRRPGVAVFAGIVLMLVFFGPFYLTMQIGTLSALVLACIAAAIVALESQNSLLAGLLLSLTLLKPPQGVPILLLTGPWLLSRGDRRALVGMAGGAAALVIVGLLADPLWLAKSVSAGNAVMNRTLGIQSNAFGIAYWVCSGSETCMWIGGGIAAAAVLAGAGSYLWRKRASLSPEQALSLIIPVAFLSTVYLWSYDQVLYVVPIVWVFVRLAEERDSFLMAFAFLSTVIVAAFIALGYQALTQSDLLSGITTLVVLAGFILMSGAGPRAAAREPDP